MPGTLVELSTFKIFLTPTVRHSNTFSFDDPFVNLNTLDAGSILFSKITFNLIFPNQKFMSDSIYVECTDFSAHTNVKVDTLYIHQLKVISLQEVTYFHLQVHG